MPEPTGGTARRLAKRNSLLGRTVTVVALSFVAVEMVVLAISGTELEVAARAAGAPVVSEIFADRGYLSSGHLVPRSQPGAMIHDAGEAVERLLGVLETGMMPVVDGDPIVLAAESVPLPFR